MQQLLNEVRTLFGSGPVPGAEALVDWDGFDLLDKETAVRFFAGKSWEAVLEHDRGHGPCELEAWSVLRAPLLSYYGRAHLEYLFETTASDSPDDGFVSQLFHQLYQQVHRHKKSPFTAAQTSVLVRIALQLPVQSTAQGMDCLTDDFVVSQIQGYLQALDPRL
ncbi:MAG: hypothetical protein V4739_19170 [Pseudomonadota bacterium]